MRLLIEDIEKSARLTRLLSRYDFTKDEMGIAIIDLSGREPQVFGYNLDHFIYPASIYKIFIGAEMLRRIEIRDFSLDQIVEIKTPNDVDTNQKIFPGDVRPLLHAGDTVSINYLLNLMLTRSDNTASNTLMDLVGRENITANVIHAHGWHGSEVTRKFLDRAKERQPYQFSSTTVSCARHIAEFFYLVEKELLISSYVSKKLKEYMHDWNRGGRKGAWIPEYRSYYRKGGWLETNLWKYGIRSLLRSIFKKGWAVIRWSNDAGVIRGKNSHYVLAVLSVHKSIMPNSYFPMEQLARVVYEFMEKK